MNDKTNWGVVLGVTGGVGAAAATALAARPGLNVYGVHRGNRANRIAAVRAGVEDAGRRWHEAVGGAGFRDEVEARAAELAEVAGPRSVRVLVHAIANASYGTFTTGVRGSLDARRMNKTFDCMAHSFVWWIQELVRRDLLAPGARLIALSNPMTEQVVAGWGLVAAAKAALEAYVRQLGAELGPQGHCVTLLKFGLVETPAVQLAFTEEQWTGLRRAVSGITTMRRIAELDEIGEFIGAICDDVGLWFNGCTIDYSGGQSRGLADPLFNPSVKR